MEALYICAFYEIASDALPVSGAKLIDKVLELLIFLGCPPSFLNVKLIIASFQRINHTRIIYDMVDQIFVVLRVRGIIIKPVGIVACKEMYALLQNFRIKSF